MKDGLNFSKKIGIDIGSAYIRIWNDQDNEVITEPCFLAINTQSNQVIAVGQDAKKMRGRVGDSIQIYQPIVQGHIYDFNKAKALLKVLLQKILKSSFFFSPIMMISMNSQSTHVQKQATVELGYALGASQVYTITQPVAAAIGSGVPIADSSGCFIFNLGAGICEGSMISLGSSIQTESIYKAGQWIDKQIKRRIQKIYEINISLQESEKIKKSIFCLEEDLELLVTGQDVVSAAPKEVMVSSIDLKSEMIKVLDYYENVLKRLLSKIPPELTIDVINKGMLLSGGLSQMMSIEDYFNQHIGVPVSTVDNADTVVIKGIATALKHLNLYKHSLGYL